MCTLIGASQLALEHVRINDLYIVLNQVRDGGLPFSLPRRRAPECLPHLTAHKMDLVAQRLASVEPPILRLELLQLRLAEVADSAVKDEVHRASGRAKDEVLASFDVALHFAVVRHIYAVDTDYKIPHVDAPACLCGPPGRERRDVYALLLKVMLEIDADTSLYMPLVVTQ